MINPLDFLAVKMYQWRVGKKRRSQTKAKQTEQEKKRAEIHKNLKDVYDFVRWLNTKGLPNRRARKDFWRRVSTGEDVMEKTINNLIEAHTPKQNPSIVGEVKPPKTDGTKPTSVNTMAQQAKEKKDK